MITVNMIREKYPNPKSLESEEDLYSGRYCVGGACVKVAVEEGLMCGLLDSTQFFPGVDELADALCAMNPSLPEDVGGYYATVIIDHNDSKEFEHAWYVVKAALGFGRVEGFDGEN